MLQSFQEGECGTRPDHKGFSLPRQVHFCKTLQVVSETTLGVLCPGLVTQDTGRQREDPEKGSEHGLWPLRQHLRGTSQGAGHALSRGLLAHVRLSPDLQNNLRV